MQTFVVKVAQRRLVILSQQLRQAHGIEPGQQLTRVDLDGIFDLSQQASQVDGLADQLAQALCERGQSLQSLLATLRDLRGH